MCLFFFLFFFFFSSSKSRFLYTLLYFALLIFSTSFYIKNDEDFVFITECMAKNNCLLVQYRRGPALPYATLSGVISPSL